MRYFREERAGTYEEVRSLLDSAWGLPDDRGTVTCMSPATKALRDKNGKIVVPLKDMFCDWEPAASLLPQLLLSGDVTEITEADYVAALPTTI